VFSQAVLRHDAIDRVRYRQSESRTAVTVELGLVAVTAGHDPELDRRLVEHETVRGMRDRARPLNRRQLTVLDLAMDGYERSQIAARLGLSERQVKRALEQARNTIRDTNRGANLSPATA